jgi:hypothetical protein
MARGRRWTATPAAALGAALIGAVLGGSMLPLGARAQEPLPEPPAAGAPAEHATPAIDSKATAPLDTITATPVPRATVEVVHTPVAVVRSGPGTQHPITATVREGERLVIDARSGPWYHVQIDPARSGWVHEDLVRTWVDPRRFEFAPDPGRPDRMRSFHLVAYGGTYAADREDNGFLAGARIGYSITSRFAFEAMLGWTRVVRTTYVLEQIFGLRLEEETFDLFFYEAGATMDLLPNRRVTPFLSAAGGASVLNSRVEPTWALGVGTKMFFTKRVAARWELRNHHLHGGHQFTRFAGDNLEFSGGVEFLF